VRLSIDGQMRKTSRGIPSRPVDGIKGYARIGKTAPALMRYSMLGRSSVAPSPRRVVVVVVATEITLWSMLSFYKAKLDRLLMSKL
jgi:hypothetical protein